MRYLVKAKVKPGKEKPLLDAIESGCLGQGSVAGDEYLDNMQKARLTEEGVCAWVEVCFCSTPLQEERPYWEQYFDLLQITDAHARKHCRDANGTEPWACCDCDCTRKLEARLQLVGESFLDSLKEALTGETCPAPPGNFSAPAGLRPSRVRCAQGALPASLRVFNRAPVLKKTGDQPADHRPQ